MDFSDIIFYIVLFVVGIISTSIQNNAKKKAEEIERRKKQNSPVESEKSIMPIDEEDFDSEYYNNEDDVEDGMFEQQADAILDNIFRALREGEPLQPSISQNKVQPQTTPTTVAAQHQSRTTLPEEGVSAISNNITASEISDSNIHTDKVTTFDTDNIDWRQAIITSEILTRKY